MINNSMKGDDEYIVIYLNSWQFVELNHSKFGLPFIEIQSRKTNGR